MSTDPDRRLSRVSLGGNDGLLNEDISLAMHGDDSFGYGEADAGDEQEETVRLDTGRAGGGPAPRAGEEQVFFGGSMAPAATTKAGTARMAPPVPATPLNSRRAPPDAYLAGDEGDDEFESALLSILASAPAPAPSSSTSDAAQADTEQPKKQEGPYSEEEVAEIRRLKEERDGLRGMNAVLGDLLGSLRGMEGKMQNFGSTVSTTHALLDLYTRIASQAEHTKDLLLDGEWGGVMKDYEDLVAREAAAAEAERLRQEQEAFEAEERARKEREAEEEARRRKREEEERSARGAPGSAGARGRGRGLRGVPSSSSLRPTRGRPSPTTTSANSSSSFSSTAASGIPTRGAGSGAQGGSARGGTTRGRVAVGARGRGRGE
ncbi:hypothetical protein NBRC10512_006140 [Rhodotorula toruloides]|uniref:DASH complex subunit DUO1 n=2 Tax=Rhodotorula toruloides TaxID=5286 RepID=A0A061BFE9_RHOTO|nr:DASH complex, subunit Duo1 [Rhodotorula toruloides NP11]EMS20094.1 DASH complex, subunit Duo1 [Rhodotorula toruloides NP11]CDR48720.1 RHTO0S19e03202g1_1 [Rhodotorula toruloides]